MILAYAPEAKLELAVILQWYDAEAGSDVRQRFIEALDDLLEQVQQHPERIPRYPPSPSKIEERWAQVRGFPYLVIFEVREGGLVLVLAMTHERRQPG